MVTAIAALGGQTLSAVPRDPVEALMRRLEAGSASLQYDASTSYLRSLLRELGVSEDSQMLVFSKTSLDAPYVSPQTPRAIYFNAEVAVALTPGAPEIELTAVGARAGLSFYTIDVRETAMPRLQARGDCGGCHQGVSTPNVLSLVMMSLPTKPDGSTFDTLPFEYVDQRTPFERRWGGWYVTGTHGSQPHRGNAVIADVVRALDANAPSLPGTQNVTTLADRFETSRYLTGTSDIVALMTFEHQAHVTNAMLSAIRASRIVDNPSTATLRNTTPQEVLSRAIDQLVNAMLFADVDDLRAPVKGVSTFAATFMALGPKDADGRSLRDLDLERRVLRHPVSYMIYSGLFDGLPEMVKAPLLQRLHDGLTGGTAAPFARYSEAERRTAFAIIQATKAGLPDYWRASPAP